MLRRNVTVRNLSAKKEPVVLLDRRVVQGRLVIEPDDGEGSNDCVMPNEIWVDHMREGRVAGLVNVDLLPQEEEVVVFAPTHTFLGEPVALTKLTRSRAYFTRADGAESYRTIGSWEEHAAEISATGGDSGSETDSESEEVNDEDA